MSDEAIFEADRRARQISDDRERLRPELVRRGFGVLDDRHGSFLLLKHPRARQLHGLLRAHGVAVRRGDTFPGLGSRWLRVAVRGEDDAARFLAVLDEVIPR
jgi:histidinol-phosphate aminotransferase